MWARPGGSDDRGTAIAGSATGPAGFASNSGRHQGAKPGFNPSDFCRVAAFAVIF
jgi:hypothetical protein